MVSTVKSSRFTRTPPARVAGADQITGKQLASPTVGSFVQLSVWQTKVGKDIVEE
eukprot:m.75627 g.75627  ORF g.75627 m.75627 type:complete len:55 (+) comp10423_c0_seq4:2845-3009(+)